MTLTYESRSHMTATQPPYAYGAAKMLARAITTEDARQILATPGSSTTSLLAADLALLGSGVVSSFSEERNGPDRLGEQITALMAGNRPQPVTISSGQHIDYARGDTEPGGSASLSSADELALDSWIADLFGSEISDD